VYKILANGVFCLIKIKKKNAVIAYGGGGVLIKKWRSDSQTREAGKHKAEKRRGLSGVSPIVKRVSLKLNNKWGLGGGGGLKHPTFQQRLWERGKRDRGGRERRKGSGSRHY